MQFVKPIPFEEAVDKLGRRSPIGSTFTSSEWADMPAELREGSFFSSRVESVRVLQRGRDAIGDFLSANRETLPDGQTALKVGSRQQFVDQMQTFLQAEGIERTSGGLTDITSERRLGLIFDTQTQQLQDYGYWKQGMDPDVLAEFPAQRFIRVVDVKEPRNSHTEFEGKVYLKTDQVWSKQINRDFGTPWGPWGWGCGHDVEDVDRDEAEQLGLLQPGQEVQPDTSKFIENMRASTRGLDPDLMAKLKGEFGDRLIIEGDYMRWNPSVPAAVPKPPAPPQPKTTTATARSTPTKWRKKMDSLAEQNRKASSVDKARLKEEALSLIEVPEALRGSLAVKVTTRNQAVIRTAQKGKALVERFVNPSYVRNTSVSIHQTHKYRSFHRGGEVHLWEAANPSTAAHEIMHAVEQQNPEVLKTAAEFLLKRGEGELPIPLRTLTGNSDYDLSEVAFKDKWLERYGDVYAGKVYSSFGNPATAAQIRATEILTMGLERLLEKPLEFYMADREWFELVIKAVRGT
jgi:hypothetical protein